jgi:hypothetical protein
VAEGEEKGSQEREEIGAAFIGMESWRIWQEVDGIEEGEEIARAVITRKIDG